MQSPIEMSNLLSILKAQNSPEFYKKSIEVLAQGIRKIDDENTYSIVKLLLEEMGTQNKQDESYLGHKLYHRSSDEYKKRLWADGLVSYFESTLLDNDPPLSGSADARVNVHFTNILSVLSKELESAKNHIKVAVAWFTNDHQFSWLCSKLKEGIIVEVIIIDDYINNWQFGLPWQKFIDLGGKLYFSPAETDVLNQKICIIDDKMVMVGSYNWTYYAEIRNQENFLHIEHDATVISAFVSEFERLKSIYHPAIEQVEVNTKSSLKRFGKNYYNDVFQLDKSLKASEISKSNAEYGLDVLNAHPELNQVADQSITDDIQERYEQEQTIIEIQEVAQAAEDEAQIEVPSAEPVISVLEPVKKDKPETEIPTPEPPIEDAEIVSEISTDIGDVISSQEATIEAAETTETITPKAPETPQIQVESNQLTKNESTSNQSNNRVISESKQSLPGSGNSSKMASNSPVTPLRPTGFAHLPTSKKREYLYDNLKVTLGLDFSNSMEAWADSNSSIENGYKLYSSGKIQDTIEKLAQVTDALSSIKQADIFLFTKEVIELETELDINNRKDFIAIQTKDRKMEGTDIHCAVTRISSKYLMESANVNQVLAIIITDGENNEETSNQLMKDYFKANSETKIFWQFIGLGSKFEFLNDLSKEKNVNFIELNDVSMLSANEIRDKIVEGFAKWHVAQS
jgi:vWA found in TerF C terminus/PLD-like domain